MKYPVGRCQNPKKICNPYTHETLVVPCGHCKGCQLNRNSHLALWCDLEAETHKYVMFVTLTYANRYIPRAKIVDSLDRPFGHDLVTSDGEILGPCDLPQDQIDRLLKKFYLFGDVPYLRKEDLQKFLKRFRYYAKKYTSSKVRYFACGEYGPVHFRPHFHLLLYFSDEALLQVCEHCVLASWPFGRVDVQLSTSSASSYVAGYVNSSSILPKVFEANAVRPFCVHSQYLGCRFLQSEREKIYSLPVEQIIKRGVILHGDYREIFLWRSYYAYFFPKCRGFGEKSASGCYDAYRLYGLARKAFPECTSVLDTARSIASLIKYFYFPDSASTLDYELRVLCPYFCDSFEFTQKVDLTSEEGSRWIARIYNELLVSRHFLFFVCDNFDWSANHVMQKIRMIKEFYSRLDYLHLTEFFENQRMFYDSCLYGDDDLMSDSFGNSYFPYFYDNLPNDYEAYKTTYCYQFMSAETDKLFYDRVKHKVLNDQNKIFFE